MSANRAPQLSQLVHASTPDPTEAEKAALREQITAASAGLIAEVKCVPDDWEDMRWEEKTVALMPLVERGKTLGVSVRVDAADAPVLAEADDVYERWTAEEAEVRAKAKQDVHMGEETAVGVGNEGTEVKMSHVEVPQLARKAPKAGPSKWAHDDDNDNIVEVVESRTCGKGKTSGCSVVSNKTATDLSQALAMVRAKAVAAHAANLRLQVCIEQLAEVLAEHGIE
ncbi:hypothetical protein M404DRAFT_25990 [Pisolithus tinctorius Marx 270]|uniref:Uncharacterized protein n=1 Tax=Pisolithus tinctorius Marx 270 TaxID=870435 RepID=A0A0C3PB76_PISTI|nr:hypothetical protein M404DRAFT_25990 [Pisolithus tinctorius Marx 270]